MTCKTNLKDRKIFLTWWELFEHLGIQFISVRYDADVKDVLKSLRTQYSMTYPELSDKIFDRVVKAYKGRSVFEQLSALGSSFQEHGLRLCYKRSQESYLVWIMKFDNTQDYLSFWKDYLTRRQFFENIDTFMLPKGTSIESPGYDLNTRLIDKTWQVRTPSWKKNKVLPSYVLSRDGKSFLCVPYYVTEWDCQRKYLHVFDMDNLDAGEIEDAKFYCSQTMLEPYKLVISVDGKEYVFLGSDLGSSNSWKLTKIDDLNRHIPVYTRDSDDEVLEDPFPLVRSLTKKRGSEDACNWSRIFETARYAYYHNHGDVLRYDRESRKFERTRINFFGFTSENVFGFTVYGQEWMVIGYPSHSKLTLDFVLWNPDTGECYTGAELHEVDSVSYEQFFVYGEHLYALLGDGRLCRYHRFEDLIDTFRHTCREVKLDVGDWIPEVKKSFKVSPFAQLSVSTQFRARSISFEDGTSLELEVSNG